MLRVVADDDASAEVTLALDEICRLGARRMLAAALEAERDAYLALLADERDEDGHRLVVGNGRARPRVVATGAGPIEVEAPRVNDKRIDEATGERCRFRSEILAPWCRKSPKVSEPKALTVRTREPAGHLLDQLMSQPGPHLLTRLVGPWIEPHGDPARLWCRDRRRLRFGGRFTGGQAILARS